MIRFAAPAYSVAEGGVATLAVVRSGTNLASSVTVDYAVTSGTAAGRGIDDTLASGTLTFGAGVTSRTFSVPVETVVSSAPRPRAR